jgi:hypothetical protein
MLKACLNIHRLLPGLRQCRNSGMQRVPDTYRAR